MKRDVLCQTETQASRSGSSRLLGPFELSGAGNVSGYSRSRHTAAKHNTCHERYRAHVACRCGLSDDGYGPEKSDETGKRLPGGKPVMALFRLSDV